MELVDKKINDALNKELEATEGTTNNLYKKLTGDKTCAIISPYRGENSDEENKKKMILLKSEIRKLKLGFNQFISRWVEDGQSFDEQSLLISDITEQQATQCVIVQCEAGISKSSGICSALMLILNENDSDIFQNEDYCPNLYCYRTILNTYFNGTHIFNNIKEYRKKLFNI